MRKGLLEKVWGESFWEKTRRVRFARCQNESFKTGGCQADDCSPSGLGRYWPDPGPKPKNGYKAFSTSLANARCYKPSYTATLAFRYVEQSTLALALNIHIAGMFKILQGHHVAKLASFRREVVFVVRVQTSGDRQTLGHIHPVAG